MKHVMHQRLDLRDGSYALLTDPTLAQTAVIFVHGFLGCPEKTWILFQTLMDSLANAMPWWTAYDAFFYAYKSLQQICPNAAALLDFISDSYPVPKWQKLGATADLVNRKYTSLILVGHSEGAVIVRWAILHRAQSHTSRKPSLVKVRLTEDEVLDARLKLFAPAYWGALLSGFPGLLLRAPVLGSLLRPLLHTSAAYKQLSETSPLLNEIRTRTVALAEKYPSVRAFRARNLFGSKDAVISSEALATDPPAEYVPDHNHVSICKPTPKYLKPLTFVRRDA